MKKDVFIAFKTGELSVLVYPHKEQAWQMDKFIMGYKLCKKFPLHAQTIKVLSLMDFPFFYDTINNKVVLITKELDNYDEIAKVFVKYYECVMHGLPVEDCIFDKEFTNDYKKDAEMLLPLVLSLHPEKQNT